jgi:hypothetical protein
MEIGSRDSDPFIQTVYKCCRCWKERDSHIDFRVFIFTSTNVELSLKGMQLDVFTRYALHTGPQASV